MRNNEKIKMVNTKQAMEILNISRVTLYRLMRRKELRYYKFGRAVRFRESDIKKFIESHEKEMRNEEKKEPKMDTSLNIFLKELRKEFGQGLKKVILFGSRAREEHDEESDFDFILVFDKVTPAIKKKISDIVAEMLSEWSIVITAFAFTEEELEMKKYEPFVMNVKKEGILL